LTRSLGFTSIKNMNIREELAKVMEPEAIDDWLNTPNPAFDNQKPSVLINNGGVKRIMGMIYNLQTGSSNTEHTNERR